MSAEHPLLTPAEVAKIFKVDIKTVARWAKAGRLSYTKTPGGHRRFFRAEIEELEKREHTTRTT